MPRSAMLVVAMLSPVVFALARGNRAAGKDHGRDTPQELLEEPVSGAGGHSVPR